MWRWCFHQHTMTPRNTTSTCRKLRFTQELKYSQTFFEIQVEDFSRLVVSIQQHRQITRQMSQLRPCPPRSTVNIWRRSPLLFSHIFTSFSFAMLKGKLLLDVPKFHVKKNKKTWNSVNHPGFPSPNLASTKRNSDLGTVTGLPWVKIPTSCKSLRFPSRIYLCKRILQRMKMDTSKWFTWLNDVHLRSSVLLCLNS